MAKPQIAQPNPMQANAMARQAVIARSLDMTQSISTQTLTGTVPGQVVNIPIRNVGLLKRLIVEVSGTIAQSAAETLTATKMSGANIFSNVTLTDLANQTRVNTTGWHLHLLASARRQAAFGAAFTSDTPTGIASNFPVMDIPSSVTTADTFRFFYEIPIAYSDYDLRGAIYASVVNATMNLSLTVNPNFVVSSTGNPTQAVYKSSASQTGSITNFTINVYQNYLDQLPTGQNGVVLPLMDLSYAYLLNQTAFAGIASAQDNPIPFSNFREFMSAICIYDNFGSSTAVGSEINYWSLQAANYTNIFKVDPFLSSLLTRNILNDDMPAIAGQTGYYFDFRKKPIVTTQYGNLELIYNPAQVQGANSQMLVGFESLALINQVVNAGSLAANQ